ncbi:MAG: aldehyde dehydrogenase family protein [Leptospirales bacterium]
MLEDILGRSPIPFLLGGRWETGALPAHTIESFVRPLPPPVRAMNPDGSVWQVARAGTGEILLALEAVSRGQEILTRLPPHRRRTILEETARGLETHRTLFARLITAEVGKPAGASLFEVERAIATFRVAADLAATYGHHFQPGNLVPQGAGMIGLVDRVSAGPVLAITPYNFPLNLLAHKVAPAIATGSALVVKPAPRGMTTALALGALLLSAGLPPEALSILPCDIPDIERLIDHPALPVVSFTGSAAVGWRIRERVPRKKVLLELGGTAAVMILEDGLTPDLCDRLISGAFAYSGQICISIQRILVARPLYDTLRTLLAEKLRELESDGRVGPPDSPRTLVGPLISLSHADAVRHKIEEAVSAGAELLSPIRQEGALLHPVLLTKTDADWPIEQEEVFGPVATLTPFDSPEEAIRRINRSRFGIQAGIFTRQIDLAIGWAKTIEAGGVLINEIPTYRLDHWPYGGVKESGSGFEGIAYAMEEMSRPRLLAIRLPAGG